jgi:prepilin-type N-terminal cleavage/methylation domain-containing protein
MQRGFTMIEVVVAMVVFGIALTGLLPLLVLLSRDLQPLRKINPDGTAKYRCTSPARDGNVNSEDPASPPIYARHIWYVTPCDDAFHNPPLDPPHTASQIASQNAWVRKLGASASLYQAASEDAVPEKFTNATLPIPIVSTSVQQDDYSGTPASDGSDGVGTFEPFDENTGWISESATLALGNDLRRHLASPAGPTPPNPAVWNITVVVTGLYSIQAAWPSRDDQVNDAVYSVFQNGEALLNVVPFVDQHDPLSVGIPDDNGRLWQPLTLGLVQLNAGDDVRVELSDVRANSLDVGKFVVADGVRIVQKNDVKIISIDRSTADPTGEHNLDVTAHAAVTVNIPQ